MGESSCAWLRKTYIDGWETTWTSTYICRHKWLPVHFEGAGQQFSLWCVELNRVVVIFVSRMLLIKSWCAVPFPQVRGVVISQLALSVLWIVSHCHKIELHWFAKVINSATGDNFLRMWIRKLWIRILKNIMTWMPHAEFERLVLDDNYIQKLSITPSWVVFLIQSFRGHRLRRRYGCKYQTWLAFKHDSFRLRSWTKILL
jgi:hypothetical protein